jgi:hypothetical protein
MANEERTLFVRVAGARIKDQADAGKVRELPYAEARQFVNEGRGQFVDGPDPVPAERPVVKAEVRPAAPSAPAPGPGSKGRPE